MPWWRTRSTGKPSALTARSARSISASVSGSTAVPYGMREARHGLAGFSALGSAQLARERADLRLACACLEQRVDDAVLGGGLQAGPPVALVVVVGAGEQRVVSARLRELGEHVVELGLAEVAAVAPVGAVAGARELVGARRLVRDADVLGDAPRAVELALRRRRARRRSRRARARRAHGGRGGDDATSRRRRRTRRRRCPARATRPSSRVVSERRSLRSARLLRRRERLRPDDLHRRAADRARRARSPRARARG